MKPAKVAKKILLLSLLVLSLALFTGFADQESVGDFSTINVVGTGNISSEPDLVSINIDIMTEGKSKDIMDETSAKTKKVMSSLEAIGINKEEIKTQNISFYPVSRWNKDLEKEENIGYRATNSIVVTSSQLNKTGEIIETAIKNGAESINRLNFTLSEQGQQKIMQQAIEKAINDASTQANTVAKTIGSEIVKIKSIDVQKNFHSRPIFLENNLAVKEDSSIPIEPEDIEFEVNIKISYLIR